MQRLADKLILFFLCFLPLLWRGEKAEIPVVAAFLTVMAYYKHKDNIKRLLGGTERKTYLTHKNKVD